MMRNADPVTTRREIDGKSIHIIDNVFDAPSIRMLYEYFRKLPYTLNEYASHETMDRPHWKREFALDQEFLSFPPAAAWKQAILSCVDTLQAGLVLTRNYINCMTYGNISGAHQDDLDGFTALYFANYEWAEDWQGETIFYDRRREPFYAVAPMPGRILLFPGDVWHRGGVPSRTCFQPRLSIAFKFRRGA